MSTLGTKLNQYDPGIQLGFSLPLANIDTTGATDGQVIAYSTSAGAPVWGSAVASALTSTHIFVGNGGGVATDVALSGDATLANTGAITIANSAISTAKIADNAVTGAKIALASQAAGDIMYYDGTDWVRLAKGTAGQVLTMNAGATAPEWQ